MRSVFKRLFLAVMAMSLLAACGGGGGNSSSSGLPVAYTGSTAQAKVTSANADSISTSAYSGSQMASSFEVLVVTPSNINGQNPFLHGVAGILDDIATTVVAQPKTETVSIQAVSTATNTVYGYSGSFTYSVTMDTVSGVTTGTLNFSQYKQTSVSITMSGNAVFSGIYNSNTATYSSLGMTLSGINITNPGTNISMSGTLSASVSGATKTYTTTMSITDNLTNKTTVLKDYVLTLTGNSLTLFGTYYDPTHGYVVITTVTPLNVSSLSATPTAGVLLFTGSNGTKARLTFVSGGYIVEVDTAGNGVYVVVP